jgi:outer membrane biosynthesis protein TonB
MTTTRLLTPRDVTACKKLAASDLADSQRAAALLAIHQGATQAAAAEATGLSIGQVKYIVTRFRRLGMQALKQQAMQPEKVRSGEVEAKKAKKSKKKPKKDKDKKKAKSKKDKDKKKDKKNKKKDKKAKKKKG